MKQIKLKIEGRSDIGVVRSTNEDFFGVFEKNNLAVICDGMGGHSGGQIASRLAVRTVGELYRALDEKYFYKITSDLCQERLDFASRLIGSIRLANQRIYNQAQKNSDLHGMGTTISALAFVNGHAIVGHVGDSRIYRFREKKLRLLTEDHTLVNELIQDKEIDALAANKLINKNIITRALGFDSHIKIDLLIEPATAGDIFLLCTDGLTKALADDEIERIIAFNKNKIHHLLKHLIDNANIKDSSDNITAVVVVVERTSSLPKNKKQINLTLKSGDNNVIRLENKILRQFYHRFSIIDLVKQRIVNRIKKYSHKV